MAESDPLADLAAAFSQVHMSRWAHLVPTFRSAFVGLSPEQEAALLAVNRWTRDAGPSPSQHQLDLLDALATHLDTIIQGDFGGSAFVKLGDTAPKDLPPPDRLVAEWHARRLSSAPAASNAALAAYVWARARSLRVTSGAQALHLLTHSGRACDELERREMLAGALPVDAEITGSGSTGPGPATGCALNITLVSIVWCVCGVCVWVVIRGRVP